MPDDQTSPHLAGPDAADTPPPPDDGSAPMNQWESSSDLGGDRPTAASGQPDRPTSGPDGGPVPPAYPVTESTPVATDPTRTSDPTGPIPVSDSPPQAAGQPIVPLPVALAVLVLTAIVGLVVIIGAA